MTADYTLPPVPHMIAYTPQELERIRDYGHAVAAPLLARIAELERSNSEFVDARRAWLASDDIKQSAIDRLRAKLAAKDARIAELEQSVETFRAARDGYRDDAFRLSADKRALLQGSQEQASEISRLRAELAQVSGYCETLTQRCVDDTAENGRLRAEVEALRADAERYWALRRVLREDMTEAQYDACIDAARGAARKGEGV